MLLVFIVKSFVIFQTIFVSLFKVKIQKDESCKLLLSSGKYQSAYFHDEIQTNQIVTLILYCRESKKAQNGDCYGAIVVAQLVERLIPTPEILRSNLVVGKF